MAITFPSTQRNILVTGYSAVTPCTMADIYNADIVAVNGRQLYTGAATGSPFSISLGTQTFGLVTTQPWVADSHGVQLKITCTARAGATLALTGKNRSGETVTETGIDISSGSATSIKKYFTLDTNGIVFTGLSSGDTITIKQDRWGVVSKIQQTYPYCVNTKYWMCEGGIQIGDYSSTPGNFASTNELFFFPGNHGFAIGSNPAGSFVIGSLSNGLPSEGSVIVHDSNGQNSNVIGVGNDSGITGNITIYDTAIKHLNRSLAYGGCYAGNYGGSVILKGIHANGCVVQSGAYTIDDICIYRSSSGGIGGGNGSVISNARVHNSLSGYSMAGQGLSDFVTGVVLDGTHSTEYLLAYAGQSPTTARLNDCVHGDNKIKANGPSNIYRTTYVDILINDILGNPISGASCLIKDMDGNIVSYNPSIFTNAITVLSSATDIVASTSWLTLGFAVGDVIVQDAEFMLITAIAGTGNKTATVTRGYYPKYPAVYHYSRIIYKAGSALSNASGVVPQQIIPLKRYLQQQGGIEGAGLATTYKDHTIIISKQGYSTYQDVITFTENDLTGQDLEISLSVYPNINFYTQSNQNRIGGNIMDIKKNEADATKRRIAIVCVDAADFATPEPGEAGGQPQKSINKGAWVNTSGQMVLVDAASGSYYVELTQAESNIGDLDTIDTRYKSANTAYAYGPTVQIKAKVLSDVVADIATVSGQVLDVEDKVDLIDNIVDSVKTETDKIAGVKAKTDNIPASPATEGNVSAVGEAVVEVGNAVVTIDGIVDAVKAKTDNLPTDPASDTNVNANETKIDAIKAVTDLLPDAGALSTIDTNIDAIKAKTDNIPASPATEGNVTAVGGTVVAVGDAVVTIDGIVDAIKAKTDNLPADPASDTNVNTNETKINTAIVNIATLDGKVVTLVSGVANNSRTVVDDTPQEITRGDEVLFTIFLSTSWNLIGKAVHFIAKADKDAADSTAIFNVVCTVGAASGGLIPCTYTLTPAQTAIKGKYYAEAEVRNTDGSVPQTAKEFPLIIRNDVRKG